MVRLKQKTFSQFLFDFLSLNSTMVRLKPNNKLFVIRINSKSQFHYGSIKTEETAQNRFKKKGLNSTMVRLKLHMKDNNIIEFPVVSIPLWFD